MTHDAQHPTAIWLDHHEAHVFHVDPDGSDEATVRAPHHVKRPSETTDGQKAHPDDGKQFFEKIAEAAGAAGEVLVMGPGTAKLEFMTYVHAHAATLEPRVVGVETVDHPTEAERVAYARKYFEKGSRAKRADRTR